MAINPNTDFTVGAVLTAAQQNRFPRGIMNYAVSVVNYLPTLTTAIATGMSVTFTAVANRNYKITYFEPQIVTPAISGGFIFCSIRVGNAAGLQLQGSFSQQNSAVQYTQHNHTVAIATFAAGSQTIVGCQVTNNLTGPPTATRTSIAPAYLMVEDIGPA